MTTASHRFTVAVTTTISALSNIVVVPMTTFSPSFMVTGVSEPTSVAERHRHFPCRQSLDVVQHDGEPLLRGKRIDRTMQRPQFLTPDRVVFSVRLDDERLLMNRIRNSPAPAEKIATHVDADPDQPTVKILPLVVTAKVAEDAEERLLHRLLHVFDVAENRPRDLRNTAFRQHHHLVECGAIARFRRSDDLEERIAFVPLVVIGHCGFGGHSIGAVSLTPMY